MTSEDRLAICLALTDTGGEVSEEIAQELDGVNLSGWEKADPIVSLIREFEEQHGQLKKAADAATAKARAASRAVDGLKGYLLARMEKAKVDRLPGPRFDVRVQASPLSIAWAGEGAVPSEFARVKVELDATKAKAAFNAGQVLPAGFLIAQGKHLRIEG